MFLQFNRRPAQLRRIGAGFQKLLQIPQATFARRLAARFKNRFRRGFELVGIFKPARQLFRAIHIKFIDLAPAVFELGKVSGIQVQLLRHLHLAQTEAFSRGNQKFAFFKVSKIFLLTHFDFEKIVYASNLTIQYRGI